MTLFARSCNHCGRYARDHERALIPSGWQCVDREACRARSLETTQALRAAERDHLYRIGASDDPNDGNAA